MKRLDNPYCLPPMDYQLLDFGNGRKLERFGEFILDRPAPAVQAYKKNRPKLWSQAHSKFFREKDLKGKWVDRVPFPNSWNVCINGLTFCLKRTPVGHLGVFVEQADNWNWLTSVTKPGMKVLNLFAYTGGSSIAPALADSSVVVSHVDSAANTVQWAKFNAQLTEQTTGKKLSIRWLTEDAERFVLRELKRGNAYNAFILDPPSYGHGAKGEIWKIADDLPRLLDECIELTNGAPEYALLTAHTPEFPAEELARLLEKRLPSGYRFESGAMRPYSVDLPPMPCGEFVRVVKR